LAPKSLSYVFRIFEWFFYLALPMLGSAPILHYLCDC
jgi:hypothetical protein